MRRDAARARLDALMRDPFAAGRRDPGHPPLRMTFANTRGRRVPSPERPAGIEGFRRRGNPAGLGLGRAANQTDQSISVDSMSIEDSPGLTVGHREPYQQLLDAEVRASKVGPM